MFASLAPEVQILAYSTVNFVAQNQSPGTPGSTDGPKGPEFGKASPIGIPIILLLLIATVALIFNMNKHIKNLPESFDPEHPEPDQLVDEGTDPAGVEAEPAGGPDPDDQRPSSSDMGTKSE